MKPWIPRCPTLACAVVMPVILVSCTWVPPNLPQEQSSDVVTGAGNLAMVSFRATAIAAIRQPLTSLRLGNTVLWHRPRELVSGNLPLDPTLRSPAPESPGTPEFEALLDHIGCPRAESGTLKWLVDGAGFFPELDRQIAGARESIDIQIYIFDNDDIGVRYADRLKRRSSEVGVRVLYDDLGTTFSHTAAPETPRPAGFVPPSEIRRYLRQDSKVHVRRVLNPWLVGDHTKLLVFDRSTAIIGGMNIGREYFSEWHDLMVRVEGPIVRQLAYEFDHAWQKVGPWGDFAWIGHALPVQPADPVAGGIPLRILRTDPGERRHEILDATLLAIRGARRRVWIETPYFAHDDIAAAVAAAARRGVDVRVIIPSRGDSNIMDLGNLHTAKILMQAGAKVFRYPKMTHMKAIICDQWACVGSANLDTLSMRINRELNLAFSQPAAVRDLENRVFQPDFNRSRRLQAHDTGKITHGFAESIADQL